MSLSPQFPVRGMYYWTIGKAHGYQDSYTTIQDTGKVDRMIEDLALWGCNRLLLWVDADNLSETTTGVRLSDPAGKGYERAMKYLNRVKHYGETAMSVGMSRDLLIIANFSHKGNDCPSDPEGLARMAERQKWLLDFFPNATVLMCWARDPGGCKCEKCAPYYANGFLRAAEQMARLYHEHVPEGKLILSTWVMPQ